MGITKKSTFTYTSNTGKKYNVTVGYWSERTSTLTSFTDLTKADVKDNFPEFLPTATFLVADNQTALDLAAFGCKSVVAGNHIGEKWYLSNGNYIEFISANRVEYHVINESGTVLLTPGGAGSDNAVGFWSYPSNEGIIIEGQDYFHQSMNVKTGGLVDIYRTLVFGGLSSQATELMAKFYEGVTPDDDPYQPGGDSDEGGGDGDFDDSSDIIPIPDLPSLSAVDTGFITLFTPSVTQLQNLANYLWTDLMQDIGSGGSLETVINDLKKIVSDPYNAIMGLSIVPVNVPTGGSKDVKMYGVLDSGVVMPYASTQYVSVDCGTLHINEYWGAYLDYAPYTKITSLYLPFVGVVTLDVDEIMGKSLHIVYHVDILSGQCIAYIIIDGSVEYQYQGHCACSIPISGMDFTNAVTSGLSLIGSISNIASSAIGGFAMAGAGGALTGATASAAANLPSIAGNVMNMKPDIKAGSGVGGMGGMLSVQKPYLIAIRPKQSAPSRQNTFTGYPSNMTRAVRDCSGYTEFDYINLDGIALTNDEKDELKQILSGGVYL